MLLDTLGDLNWLAILVATLAWFVFSAVWYSIPPISGPWVRAAKVDPGQGPPLAALLAPTFLGYFVTATVIAILARATGSTDAADAISLGVLLGLGFGIVSALIAQLYEQKGGSYWLINGINAVVAYTIVALIVTLWD